MIKIPFTYQTYTDETVTDLLIFHMSMSDYRAWAKKYDNGLPGFLKRLEVTQDVNEMQDLFTDLVTYSYCELSNDGRRRLRGPAITEAFLNSAAWEAFFLDLMLNDNGEKKATALFKGIFPKELMDRAEDTLAKSGQSLVGQDALRAETAAWSQSKPAARRAPQDHLQKSTPTDDNPWGTVISTPGGDDELESN